MSDLPEHVRIMLDGDLDRRVIVVMDAMTYEKLDYDAKLRDKVKQAGVLPLPENLPLAQHPVLRTLGIRGLWQRDSVLAQNPYHLEHYELGDEPHSLFAQARLRIMVEVAHLLGAKSFDYEENHASERDSRTRGGLGGGKGVAKGEARLSSKTRDALRHGSEIHHRWDGQRPDIDGARDLLRRTNLGHDSALNHLIALRTGPNSHLSVTERFDLLSEASSTIKLAAKVKAGLYEGHASGRRGESNKLEFSVTYKIVY